MLSSFIRSHMSAILQEWDDFAGTLRPAALKLDRKSLRNTAEHILNAVADDMDTHQSRDQRRLKSRGELEDGESPVVETAQRHAGDRFAEMFTLNQLVAEYRALRATVVRHWNASLGEAASPFDELTRFNEAIDQSLSEAIRTYDRRLNEARDLFLGVLAHDLRNPLGAIQNSAAAMLARHRLEPGDREAAALVRNSSLRMSRMIDDLLDFTRLRFGERLPIEIRPTNLARLCAEVVEEIRASSPTAVLATELPGELLGEWDAARLTQVLVNLVDNAVQHGDGGPITVSADGDDTLARVRVHNTGPAIPAEQQRTIFHPFVRPWDRREGRSQRTSGVGLGLYISQEIVEGHGGALHVESTDASGTTFVMELPRGRGEAAGPQ